MKIEFLTLCACAAALAGCTAGFEDESAPAQQTQRLAVRAAAAADTRGEVTEGGKKSNFVAGDRLGVYLYQPQLDYAECNIAFTGGDEVDANGWRTFAQSEVRPLKLAAGMKAYAYYPYTQDENHVTGHSETRAVSAAWDGMRFFTVEGVQEQAADNDCSHLDRYRTLAAVPTEVRAYDTGNGYAVDFKFSQVFATEKITVVNSTGEALTVRRLDLAVDEGLPLTGLFKADLSADPSFANTAYQAECIEPSDKVSVSFAAPVTLAAGAKLTAYAVVNPVAFTKARLTVKCDGKNFETQIALPQAFQLRREAIDTFAFEITPESAAEPLADRLARVLAEGGTLDIDEPMEVLDLSGAAVASADAQLTLSAEVGRIVLGTEADIANGITITLGRDLRYPQFETAQNLRIKNLTLEADPASTAVCTEGLLLGFQSGSVRPAAIENFTVDGLKFQGRGITTGGPCPMKKLTIRNCEATDMRYPFAVVNDYVEDLTVADNVIAFSPDAAEDYSGYGSSTRTDPNDAIYIKDASGQTTVTGNRITGAPHHGIFGEHVSGTLTVTGNEIDEVTAGRNGIKLYRLSTDAATIARNTIEANSDGILLNAMSLPADSRIDIVDNTITTNSTNKDGKCINIDGSTGEKPLFTITGNGCTAPDDAHLFHIDAGVYADGSRIQFFEVELSTPRQLAEFAAKVNEGDTFKGKTVLLTGDIDMQGVAYTPAGSVASYPSKTFAGTFDGQNFTIRNLVAAAVPTAAYETAGLFGSITGVVKNVRLENVTVTSHHYAGAVVGFSSTNVGMRVENCHVDGATITSEVEQLGSGSYDNGDKAGGIIGYCVAGDAVTGCSVRNATITAYRDLGGIAGCAAGAITDNKVEKVTLIQNLTNGYKDPAPATIGAIVGRKESGFTESGNVAAEVTISSEIEAASSEGVAAALAAASDGTTIRLAAGEYTLPSSFKANCNVRFAGAGRDKTFVKNAKETAAGAKLAFENLTLQIASADYTGGFRNSAEVAFNDCTIDGQYYGYAAALSFTNCTFEQTSPDFYNIWTYGSSDCRFRGCTFHCAGKSVLIYTEEANAVRRTYVDNCTFEASAVKAGKAAIQMHTEFGISGELTIDNTTATGFDTACNGGLWNELNNTTKEVTHNFVKIVDGVQVDGPQSAE